MPSGKFNPVIRAEFRAEPLVVYSPMLPVMGLPPAMATNRFEPDTATAVGLLNPVISAEFTVAPEVVYSLIVPASLLSQ